MTSAFHRLRLIWLLLISLIGLTTGSHGSIKGHDAGRDEFFAAKGGMSLADEIVVLRQAMTGKGNFGVGSASHADAMRLGNACVGNGSRVASDGRTLVSADGLRTFRPPSAKPKSPYATTGVQANFETLQRTFFNGVERLKVIRNGHLDITP
jgi:filamentous hemagglutinin